MIMDWDEISDSSQRPLLAPPYRRTSTSSPMSEEMKMGQTYFFTRQAILQSILQLEKVVLLSSTTSSTMLPSMTASQVN